MNRYIAQKFHLFLGKTLKIFGELDFFPSGTYSIDSLSGDARVYYHELSYHSTQWYGKLTRKDVNRVGVRCGIVETCRNGAEARSSL